MPDRELRRIWQAFFSFDWRLGLFLIIIICIPRFFLVLHANASGNYGAIGVVMIVSATAPFIFLGKYGRRRIGLARPANYPSLLLAFIGGLLFSLLLYLLGELLFGSSYHNWYKYIGKSYKIPEAISERDKAILFSVMAITGMSFSPIGEELFFRGIVHGSFARSFGEKNASIIDSGAFALTHLSHFGIVFINNEWKFLLLPALLWVASMFLVSVLFFYCKRKSRSLVGAIVCHAAFNLGMIYCIFYWL